MRTRRTMVVAFAGAVLATAGTGAVAASADTTATSAQATRQFEGTVVSVQRPSRTFRLRDTERGTATIRVTSSTSYERVGGFAGLRAGMTAIEADVRRRNGAWVAIRVERSGGGGVHGGRRNDDRGGEDDRGRGRGGDERGGDDRGRNRGRGGGDDDGGGGRGRGSDED